MCKLGVPWWRQKLLFYFVWLHFFWTFYFGSELANTKVTQQHRSSNQGCYKQTTFMFCKVCTHQYTALVSVPGGVAFCLGVCLLSPTLGTPLNVELNTCFCMFARVLNLTASWYNLKKKKNNLTHTFPVDFALSLKYLLRSFYSTYTNIACSPHPVVPTQLNWVLPDVRGVIIAT